MSNTFNLKDLSNDFVCPIGEQHLEVLEVANKKGEDTFEGMGSNGKPFCKFNLKLKIHDSVEFKDLVFYTGIWDNQVVDLVKGMGKDPKVALGETGITKEKIKAAILGGFFRANVGEDKKGFAVIAKILPHQKEEV